MIALALALVLEVVAAVTSLALRFGGDVDVFLPVLRQVGHSGVVRFFVFIATAASFLGWFRLAYGNVEPLGHRRPSGWAGPSVAGSSRS